MEKKRVVIMPVDGILVKNLYTPSEAECVSNEMFNEIHDFIYERCEYVVNVILLYNPTQQWAKEMTVASSILQRTERNDITVTYVPILSDINKYTDVSLDCYLMASMNYFCLYDHATNGIATTIKEYVDDFKKYSIILLDKERAVNGTEGDDHRYLWVNTYMMINYIKCI